MASECSHQLLLVGTLTLRSGPPPARAAPPQESWVRSSLAASRVPGALCPSCLCCATHTGPMRLQRRCPEPLRRLCGAGCRSLLAAPVQTPRQCIQEQHLSDSGRGGSFASPLPNLRHPLKSVMAAVKSAAGCMRSQWPHLRNAEPE